MTINVVLAVSTSVLAVVCATSSMLVQAQVAGSGKHSPKQVRHPVSGSLPPQGAKCIAHGHEHVYWNPVTNWSSPPAPIYLNETLVPIMPDWNFHEGCKLWPKDADWACCSKEQYQVMNNKEKLFKEVMSGCPACAESLRDLFCWYTCGPWQWKTNAALHVLPDGQVLTTQIRVTYELSQRIWKACENAGIGIETFKKTYQQNKVEGIFDLIVDFSPATTLKNGSTYKILGHVQTKPTCDEFALGWNVTTTECNYSCSNPDYATGGCPTVNPNCPAITAAPGRHGNMTNAPGGAGSGSYTGPPGTPSPAMKYNRRTSRYPLPRAEIKGMPMQYFVAILLAVLLGAIGAIGFLNRNRYEDREWNEEDEKEEAAAALLQEGASQDGSRISTPTPPTPNTIPAPEEEGGGSSRDEERNGKDIFKSIISGRGSPISSSGAAAGHHGHHNGSSSSGGGGGQSGPSSDELAATEGDGESDAVTIQRAKKECAQTASRK